MSNYNRKDCAIMFILAAEAYGLASDETADHQLALIAFYQRMLETP